VARELPDRNRRMPVTTKPCPTCYGAPELVVKDARHVPKRCETCQNRGVVPRDFWPEPPVGPQNSIRIGIRDEGVSGRRFTDRRAKTAERHVTLDSARLLGPHSRRRP
jgi:hypothetical protein